ncbi:g1613 [Coccomyxa elongata]
MADPQLHPARILVSSTRKPISYINLAKRFLQEHGEVHLSALGIALASLVTVAEILKDRGLAVEKRLCTSLESLSDDYRTRQKPKMDVVLVKSPDFDDIIAQESRATAGDDVAAELEGALAVDKEIDEEGGTGKEVDEVHLLTKES